jgi:hypothetical protein
MDRCCLLEITFSFVETVRLFVNNLLVNAHESVIYVVVENNVCNSSDRVKVMIPSVMISLWSLHSISLVAETKARYLVGEVKVQSPVMVCITIGVRYSVPSSSSSVKAHLLGYNQIG